jgi:hypothetical protein
MKGLIGALLIAGSVAVPAHAEILFSNNFDAENSGSPSSTFSAFSGLYVASGPVHLVAQGANGLPCANDTGLCVNLKGTASSYGTLRSSSTFSFQAGDTVALSWDLRGMRTTNFVGNFLYGFDFTGPATITTKNGTVSTSQLAGFDSLEGSSAFQTKTLSFSALSAGSFSFFLGGKFGNEEGMLLDNVVVQRTPALSPPAVPEPATWAMMLSGFGLLGFAARRRLSPQMVA